MGGRKLNPSYYDLGDHTESLQVDFDPQQVTYAQLLQFFFEQHDPSRAPFSRQYRSAIFYHSPEQQQAAQEALAAARRARGHPLHTSIEPAGRFYRAEDYHHKYYLRHDSVLMPELARLLPSELEFEDSTLVMRLNALAGGYSLPAEVAQSLDLSALSPAAQAQVQRLQQRQGGTVIRCS